MTREELRDSYGIEWTNRIGDPDIDYVMWLEDKLLSLPPADATAEEFLNSKKIWLGTRVADMNAPENYFVLKDLLEGFIAAQRQPQPTEELDLTTPPCEILLDAKGGFSEDEPTAEGAEEILKAEDYICEWCDKTYGGGKELEDWTSNEVMRFADDFATLTADKIVEKKYYAEKRETFIQAVFEEKLREELIKYAISLFNKVSPDVVGQSIDEYIKSREK